MDFAHYTFPRLPQRGAPLINSRHEKFAQELAAGYSAAEAYGHAGYRANFGNCIRLKGNESVAAGLAELQSLGAARTEVTIASQLPRRVASFNLE